MSSETGVLAPQQRDVWQRYRQDPPGGATEAELVDRYLPLVKQVVGRVALTLPDHVDGDDLESVGVIGLLNALRSFDESNGASFETYARIRIRGAVLDELRRMDVVSRGVRTKARQVQAAMQEVEQKKGAPATEAEVAQALKLSLPEYQNVLDEIRPVTFVCLDAVMAGDSEDGTEQHETIADATESTPLENAARHEMAETIAHCIQHLPEVQQKVLALYYFEDLRLREIATAFGLTESRICQIHSQAILAIKSHLEALEVRIA